MSFLPNCFSHNRRKFAARDNRPIVFINSRLRNCNTIVQKVIPQARAFILGWSLDGVTEITRILKPTHCREVYIITDGFPGCLYLGSSELSINTLIQYASELEGWFKYEDSNAYLNSPQLFLYNCNVAAGDVGEEFISKLNQITTAEVSASANIDNNILLNS